jgi:hypothetical protein
VQRAGRLRELLAMQNVIFRDVSDAVGELSQYVGEQAEVNVHVYRFVHVVGAGPLENQRNTGRIETGGKS